MDQRPVNLRPKAQPRAPTRRTAAERERLDREEAERRQARDDAEAVERAKQAAEHTEHYGLATTEKEQRERALNRQNVAGSRRYKLRVGGRAGYLGNYRVQPADPPGAEVEAAEASKAAEPTGPAIAETESHGAPPVEDPADSLQQPQDDNSELPAQDTPGTPQVGSVGRAKRGKKNRGRGALRPQIPRSAAKPKATKTEPPKEAEQIQPQQEEPEFLGYISDESESLPRSVNIEELNLISDDDAADGTRWDLPVRLQRKVHRIQTLGINTEASSSAAAELRRQAEERGQAIGYEDALANITRRSRTKERDLDFLDVSGVWKGVYTDEPSIKLDDEPAPEPEPEPDPDLMDLDPPQHSDEAMFSDESEPDAQPQPHPGPKAKEPLRPKQTKRRTSTFSRPQQTTLSPDEQREVYARKTDREAMRTALQDPTNVAPGVYLFQLPPRMPDLHSKDSALDPHVVVKEEDVKLEETLLRLQANDEKPYKPVEMQPGFAGTLNVHSSGRTSVTWGGADFTMRMGVVPSFFADGCAGEDGGARQWGGADADAEWKQDPHCGRDVEYGTDTRQVCRHARLVGDEIGKQVLEDRCPVITIYSKALDLKGAQMYMHQRPALNISSQGVSSECVKPIVVDPPLRPSITISAGL